MRAKIYTKFNEFLRESLFSQEELNALYNDNDNAEMYNTPPAPQKPFKPKTNKDNNDTAKYTLELLNSRLNMVKNYPEYYNFINALIDLMKKRGWEKVSVPDHIDNKLSRVNGIHNLPERDRFKLLQSIKNTTLRGVSEA